MASRKRRAPARRKRHGRKLRPGSREPSGKFHDAGGKPQIEQIGDRGDHGRRRRYCVDQKIEDPGGIAQPGTRSCAGRHRCPRANDSERRACRRESFGVRAKVRNGDDHRQRGETAAHTTRRPGGYHSSPAAAIAVLAGGARKHREIAEPPGGNAGAGKKCKEENACRRRSRARARRQRRESAPPNGPSRGPRS